MNVIRNNIIVPDNKASATNNSYQAVNQNTQTSFNDLLNKKISESTPLQFSKHANMRLNVRDIQLSTDQLKRVEAGVSKAMEKGIRDSLVLVDNVALVVNVKNKMVITAMQNSNESVYTNIDGAVIV